MPRIGPPPPGPRSPVSAGDGRDTADASATTDTRAAGTATPAAPSPDHVDAIETLPRPEILGSPSVEIGASWNGYRWDRDVFDDVMRRFAVGDAQGLAQTAAALDCGNRYLSRDELVAAARQKVAYVTTGYRWSPSVLADVMKQTGVAEETALLRAAKKHDDGDRVLDRGELERAAGVLNGIVAANDPSAIADRILALEGRADVEVDVIARIHGVPILSARFEAKNPDPLMHVVVTSGQHGNEPCGPAAAMLLIEQLVQNPRLREDISFTIIPGINPKSLKANLRRTLEDDVDTNREWDNDAHGPREVQVVQNYLRDLDPPIDLGLDLHSGYAKRDGFWIYSKGDGAEDFMVPAVDRFEQEWPVLHNKPSPIRPGVIPSSGNGGTLKDWFVEFGGAQWAATLEAPGSLSYKDMVLGENELVHDIVEQKRAELLLAQGAGNS